MRHTFFPLLTSLVLGLASSRPAAQHESPFMQECRKLMEVKAFDEIGPLIKKNEEQAILAVVEICQAIGDGSNDTLEAEIDALGKGWKQSYGTKFVTIVYDYFSVELTGPFKKQRRELIDRYNLRHKEFSAAEQAKDQNRFAGLGQEFNAMGDQFADLGDHYMAGQCYRLYAICFDEGLSETQADFKLACEGWGLYLQARERIELKDRKYDEAKARLAKLEADGFGAAGKAPEAAAAKAATDPAYKAMPLNAQFELLPDIEAIQRPLYTADSNFQIWTTVQGISKVDTKGTIPTMENSPSVLRTGANKAAVDVDGDGKGDVDIPLTGKIMAVQFPIGSGKIPWGMLAVIGQQKDMYQGFAMNLAPDENQMGLYVAPAGSLVGTVETVRVRVIDDNMDGIYGSPPKDWGYIGLRDGAVQHDMDSVVVGESKVARPWSQLQKIGESWFKLAPNEQGTDLDATRADVETGTLQLDIKGLSATWVIVRGTTNKELFFDVANGGTNKVEVPAGSYELYSGQVATGKKAQMMKAMILPGSTTRSWKVSAGATVKVELGAPFGFDFKFTQDEENVTVEGPSIVVVGRAGETYQRLWNCVLSPEVLVRKAGSSKGKKEAKLVPASSQETLQETNDYRNCWFPIGKPFAKPGKGETVELQLFEKKHKLFGKIESEWKAN